MNGKIGCVGYINGEIFVRSLLYFPMNSASGKTELSERYIKKLNCGHTLQSYDAVVLQRNNSTGTRVFPRPFTHGGDLGRDKCRGIKC